MDIDVDSVVESLIRTKKLSKLIEDDQKFLDQIKLLRCEMHTLLYQNYNKLINAAQTIRQMSYNFDQMETELTSLSDNMVEITKRYNKVYPNLSDKFQHLSKLSSQYSTLKGVQFLLDSVQPVKKTSDQQQLLRSFVFVHGQKFSLKVQESFQQENWMTEDSPESVRPTIIEIVEEIAKLSDNLHQYCDESTQIPKKSILFGISKIMLKAIVECTRLCTFSKNGLQQIQLDVQYLQHQLGNYVSDKNVILAILDDVMTSAEIRSV